jgi:hypothetical protein
MLAKDNRSKADQPIAPAFGFPEFNQKRFMATPVPL